jgi:hypothetical protein
VPFALEVDVRLCPQRLHDLDLFFRAAAAIVKILVEANELDLVPSDPDSEPEPATGQHVERCRLLGDKDGLTLREDQHLRGKIADLRTP